MSEVLVIDSGGRGAALKETIGASDEVDKAVMSPDAKTGLAQLSDSPKPLVVIGPEAPLVDGLADELRKAGYPVFGAGKEAARYEASKSFSTRMMRKGIPHPKTFIADHLSEALDYVGSNDPTGFVMKADGLAGGKGVVLPNSYLEAAEVTEGMMNGSLFGGAGKEAINYQERHEGPEISIMAVVGDNDDFAILSPAQDHKRLGEGDTGLNTGGMGSYAPVPEEILSPKQYRQIHEITANSLSGMREYGTPFERGLLYIGFMLSEKEGGNPLVLEYNARFGDPETQAQMALLQKAGVDVYRLLRSAAEGNLEKPDIDMSKLALHAISFCLAAHGYPDNPRKGDPIWGLDKPHPGVDFQLAAVKDNKTNGGRVAYATAVAGSLALAADMSLEAIDLAQEGPKSGKVGFDGMQVRRDIGHQAR